MQSGYVFGPSCIYTMFRKISLQYSIHNFNKFKYIFIPFGKNHLRLHFTKILDNFAHVLAHHYVVLT